jgi:opacity protein-like surface antigen
LPGNKDVNSTTNNVAIGIGAQYSITDSIALRAQYEDLGTVGDTNTGTTKMTLITAGVVYSF